MRFQHKHKSLSLVCWFACVVALLAPPTAQATLLLYEPFPTTTFSINDAKLGRISGQWNLGNNTDANDGWSKVRSAAALSYSSLITSNGSRGVARIANTYTANRNIGASWATAVTSGSVYCSFLVNVTTAPSANRALLVMGFFGSGNISGRNDGCGAVAWLTSDRQLQVGKYSTSVMAPDTTTALDSGVTYLVVLKYTFNPTTTSDDQVALYLNPLTADPEPGSPTISTTAGTDSSQMKSVWLPQSQSPEFGSYTGEILMDEIRVGTSWADVLPNDGQAPPTVREPVFTEAFLAGNNLVLNGANGPPNGGYEMLRSRDEGLPPAGWSGVGVERFTGDGNFSFTNPVAFGDAAGFYRLRVISTTPWIPPAITVQPQDLGIEVGQNAMFNVTALGTAPLTYRWYYNTNTLVAAGTNATLTITNAQISDSGRISVAVSNLLGVTNSVFATLTVTNNTQPPGIAAQPGSLTVPEGQIASFSVTATGARPLHYQWYFNTNTALAGETNSVLTLPNVQSNQAGFYSVTVTNAYGITNSQLVSLTVSDGLDFSLVGFGAATAFGLTTTTGGEGGATLTVSNATDFLAAIADSNPLIIRVVGTITLSGPPMHDVTSNKSILGVGSDATISGGGLNIGLPLSDSITSPPPNAIHNVIIRNLTFTNAPDDCVNVQMFSHHVWVDHCSLGGQADGAFDFKRGSEYVTASWNHFRADSDKSSLVGHADDNGTQDIGRLKITYHHNFFESRQRNPRVRFGEPVHIFNNHYLNVPGYGVASQMNAGVLVENNYFDNVEKPTRNDVGGEPGRIVARGNINVNGDGDPIVEYGTVEEAGNYYNYSLQPAEDVPATVTLGAGVGKVTF